MTQGRDDARPIGQKREGDCRPFAMALRIERETGRDRERESDRETESLLPDYNAHCLLFRCRREGAGERGKRSEIGRAHV